ncbi:CU044_5270 family protein [Streptosporangium amethystogenes]|uniref:CU044_5270 family protein n=1 Tax=Streptosporangium amethystogenes TaxID=2002 RepID=UPI0004CB4F80|nr:CU044_5270 family protein [Streptosporangium amethystogenes]
MNEFQFIDDAMPDVPLADPVRVAETKARALNGARLSRRRIEGRSRGRFGWAVAAVATATVVAFVMTVPRLGTDTAPPAGGPGEVLEAVADRAAARPEPVESRYWRTTTEIFLRVRVNGYVVDDWGRQTLWYSPTLPTVREWTRLGTVPSTEEDRAAWERAGSPELCELTRGCGDDHLPPVDRTLVMPDPPNRPARPLQVFGVGLDLKEIRELPKNPVDLKARLLTYWPVYSRTQPKGPAEKVDDWLWSVGTSLLWDAPISPGTGAAVYRMLAGLPDARIIGTAQGPHGRAAIALARSSSFEGTESRILIDPSTGDPLGLRKMLVTARDGMPSGAVTTTITVQKSGWTDTSPRMPKGCTLEDAERCVY